MEKPTQEICLFGQMSLSRFLWKTAGSEFVRRELELGAAPENNKRLTISGTDLFHMINIGCHHVQRAPHVRLGRRYCDAVVCAFVKDLLDARLGLLTFFQSLLVGALDLAAFFYSDWRLRKRNKVFDELA